MRGKGLGVTRRGRVALVALLVLLVALLAWSLWPIMVLEVRAGEGGQVLRSLPVSPGDRVVYSYVHSVQRTRVDEILEVAPAGGLVVRETVYDMTGAGLPSDLPDGDFSLDPSTGKYRITNMSRELPIFRVRVAFTAEQTLEVGGARFRLDSLSNPTTLLLVEATNRPRVVTMVSR